MDFGSDMQGVRWTGHPACPIRADFFVFGWDKLHVYLLDIEQQHGGVKMNAETTHIVGAANASEARRRDTEIENDRRERSRRENRNFVQVYPLGWARIHMLAATDPTALRLYAWLAENIGENGALVAEQSVIAEALRVSTKTVQRKTAFLEEQRALVRIRLQGGVFAYCLNPEEVWRAYDEGKPLAAFNTRTIVKAKGREADAVRRKLAIMVRREATQLSD